jgi:uncharacterized protein (DUF1810 family)
MVLRPSAPGHQEATSASEIVANVARYVGGPPARNITIGFGRCDPNRTRALGGKPMILLRDFNRRPLCASSMSISDHVRAHLPAGATGRNESIGSGAQGRARDEPFTLVTVSDSFDLQRFVDAQDQGGTYDAALAELRAGRKTSHWMWFVFPQIAGLGQSPISRRFAISSLDEARAYLAHPVLGPRLVASAQALTQLPTRSADEVFGPIDALKLRSSMTLFARADPDQPVFGQVLDEYFGGVADGATDRRL